MDIHGLTVCVNYADLLKQGLSRWLNGLSSMTVITDGEDIATRQLVER